MNDNISNPRVGTNEFGTPTPELKSMLESMSDDEVKKLIADCNKLLRKRDRQHQKQVQAQIKKMATDAGIKVSFSNKSARKAQALKSG